MNERVRRTVLLLESLDDYLPSPNTSSGAIAAQSGVTKQPPCATCNGDGRTKWGRCHACAGAGTHTPLMESWQLDAEISRLEHDARLRRGENPGGLEAWERERRRYERHGDYVALRRALERLAAYVPGRVRLVTAVHVYRIDVKRTERVQRELDDTLHCLSELMPSPIRVPSWIDQAAARDRTLRLAQGRSSDSKVRARRDVEIRRQAAGGARQADLAAAWALSTRQIRSIVNAEAAVPTVAA